jgi:hypothetical protein
MPWVSGNKLSSTSDTFRQLPKLPFLDSKMIQSLGSGLTFSMFIHPPNPAPRSKTGVSLGSSDLTILSPDTFRKEVVGAILALCVVVW